MTEQEVAQLLAIDATFTGRQIDTTMVKAWHAILGDLDGRDCLDALRRYYRESNDGRWLMPGHIVARVRTTMIGRREEKEVAEFLAIKNSRPENTEQIRAIEAGAEKIGNEPAFKSSKGDRSVPCKWCGAKTGQPCTTPGTQRRLTFVHPSRLDEVQVSP